MSCLYDIVTFAVPERLDARYYADWPLPPRRDVTIHRLTFVYTIRSDGLWFARTESQPGLEGVGKSREVARDDLSAKVRKVLEP